MYYAQVAGFRSALRTGCKVQECITHGVQGSRVNYTQGAGFRLVIGTGCKVQGCIEHKEWKGSEVR